MPPEEKKENPYAGKTEEEQDALILEELELESKDGTPNKETTKDSAPEEKETADNKGEEEEKKGGADEDPKDQKNEGDNEKDDEEEEGAKAEKEEKKSDEEGASEDGKPEKEAPLADITIDAYQEAIASGKMTKEEAEQEVLSINKLKSKYKGDVNQLSKAALYALRMASRTQQELKSLKDTQVKNFDFSQSDKVIWNGKEYSRDFLIDQYKKDYPDKAERLETEGAIFDDAKQLLQTKYDGEVKKARANYHLQANEKRTVLLGQVSDEDVPFIDEIKSILDTTPDHTILNDKFDITPTVRWARGGSYHESIKEAYQKGYEKGKSESKILTEKGKEPAGSTKTKSKSKVSLTASQKKEAEELYDEDKIPNEKKWELYQEQINFENELNKRKKAS